MFARIKTALAVRRAFVEAQEGQTMAEYGLLLALIALVVAAAAALLGPQIAALFTQVGAAL
jgi:pilus assembly protein Flp/PilA